MKLFQQILHVIASASMELLLSLFESLNLKLLAIFIPAQIGVVVTLQYKHMNINKYESEQEKKKMGK